jgi:UDP-N-acetylmuramoylalanine--D-glutamate ligase
VQRIADTEFEIQKKMDRDFFRGREVLVMGLGRFGGGVDVAKFLTKAGAKVTVTDLAGAKELSNSISQLKESGEIKYKLGCHEERDFTETDIIVANPAVASDNKFLKAARKKKRLITSQIGIFFELCPAKIIGITGANGKSTTTASTVHLLRAGLAVKNCRYTNVWLSGNIGNEPLLMTLDEIKPSDLVVLEMSSFQIEQLAQTGRMPQIALLTNLTPNHLDRYSTFEQYCAAKEHIFRLQKLDEENPAVSIFNAEDVVGCKWFEKYSKGAGRRCIKFSANDVSAEVRKAFPLPGRANLSNLAAAMSIAMYFGVEDEVIRDCLPEFKALPHRLELVAQINGVKYYNDSKATTPESTIVALESFEQPEVLIAGGYDKGISFDELGKKIAQKVKAAILIGQTAGKIANAIGVCGKTKTKIKFANSLAEAIESARQTAVRGDVVLLSPACASYDMFDNFEQRGGEFCRIVRSMRS